MDDEELSKLITASALAGAAEAQARDDQLEQETLFVRMPGKACGRLFLIEAEGD